MRDYGDGANLAKAQSLALQGWLFSGVLALLSMISIRLGPIEAAMTCMPLIAIFLWPREASFSLSAVMIFALGLGIDILSGGPPGLWALIYMSLYGILRPDLRVGDHNWRQMWLRFSGWVITAILIAVVLGAVAIDGATAYWPLLMQGVAALLVFPVVYAARQGLRSLVMDPDDPRAAL